MSDTNSWSRNGESVPAPEHTEEKIILPDEDVFDLSDFVDDNTHKEVKQTVTQEQVKPSKPINPENLRHSNEEKYFYQTNKSKSKESSNWFILTFLMTVVILGSIYFYFLIEEKNMQISGLERQISNKADTRVKGANETIVTNSTGSTATPESINTSTFTILKNNQNPEFKISNISVSIPYFNNQIGTKTILSKETIISTNKYSDSIEIFTAEKQDLIDKNVIIKKLTDTDSNIENTNNTLNSANNVNFSELRNKNNNKNKMYVGVTQKYMYVIVVNNESIEIQNQSSVNNFLKNIVINTSFN